jgi:two-component system, OmpR family, heavy metal sensor histidine kinase CusS
MTTSLTLYYTLSVFSLLTAASAFLYFGLERNIEQENGDYLRQKMLVLTQLLATQPFNRSGVEQEVHEEAEISRRSRSPFFLRILDLNDHLVVETPGMASLLPASIFPMAAAGEPRQRSWRSGNENFLLGSVSVSASALSSSRWHIQAALNVGSEQGLLVRYRRDIAMVLISGVLMASAAGAVVTRRGLRPLTDITRATERIGAHQLQERMQAGRWPKELVSLAAAFDRMLDRLQESFARLSQFSADLAHELRTPINNLMGEAQVALSRPRTPAEYARLLQSALEEQGRLARMIDSMLFLAQADQARSALAPILLDGRTQLQAVSDFYQALAEEQGVELLCKGENRLAADPVLLRRALSNLLSNALKYTPRGGRVTLLAAEESGAVPTLSVIDSGIGIAAEHLPKLGDRFYRVEPSRAGPAGAGLGLAIVRSIMGLHGGKLLMHSAVGRGTTASLVFCADSRGASNPTNSCALA